MGNKQTCAQTRDRLENPKRIKTEQSSSRSLLQHKETKRKLHQYSCNPTLIHENFQLHRKALVRLLQISLSLHTPQTKKLCNSPPQTTRSLSLSLSPAPYGSKFKPEWGRVLAIAPPTPLRVSILGIKFDNHRHPKIKYPDWYIPAVNQTIKFPVITHHHGYYTRLKYPVIAYSFGSQSFLNFFVFSNKNKHVWFWKNIMLFFFFLFLNSNSWIQRPLIVFILLYFILFYFVSIENWKFSMHNFCAYSTSVKNWKLVYS